MAPRPPSWAISNTSNRIRFDEKSYVKATFKNYRDEDLIKVFEPLSDNTNVEIVRVITCKVGDASSRSMRKALSENCYISEVAFRNCTMNPKRMKRILQGIVSNAEEGELVDLSFVDCNLDDRSAR